MSDMSKIDDYICWQLAKLIFAKDEIQSNQHKNCLWCHWLLQFVGTISYWMDRGSVRAICLAHKPNTQT